MAVRPAHGGTHKQKREAAVVVDVQPKAHAAPSSPRPLRSRICGVFAIIFLLQFAVLIYYESTAGFLAGSEDANVYRSPEHPHHRSNASKADRRRGRRSPSAYVLGVTGGELGTTPDTTVSSTLSSGSSRRGENGGDVQDALQMLGYRGDLTIPKLFHQCWRDSGFPKDMFNWRWQAGLIELNPDWTLMRWTDETSRNLISDDYPWFLKAYDAYPSYIQRSDAARYFIVYHYGGVYLDLDYECSRPFAPVLAGARAVFSFKVGTNMSRGVANAIFASEARHQIWPIVFDLLLDRAAIGASATSHVDVIRSTGPGLLRAAIEVLDAGGSYTGQGGAPVPRLEHLGALGGIRETHQRNGRGLALGADRAAKNGPDMLNALGVRIMPSAVWHPLLPEQKRGRDASPQTLAQLAASYCVHHFVSSWVVHNKTRHASTDSARRAALGEPSVGLSPSVNLPSMAGTTVPIGQALRSSNTWRSFKLGNDPGRSGGPAAQDNDGEGGRTARRVLDRTGGIALVPSASPAGSGTRGKPHRDGEVSARLAAPADKGDKSLTDNSVSKLNQAPPAATQVLRKGRHRSHSKPRPNHYRKSV